MQLRLSEYLAAHDGGNAAAIPLDHCLHFSKFLISQFLSGSGKPNSIIPVGSTPTVGFDFVYLYKDHLLPVNPIGSLEQKLPTRALYIADAS
ncbi:hypothetical protein RISK_000327 [Rhodopirellula islandica]|uniref:Uncharacterized protein n=1 Tax=Rhodopirellula islandica TaxID=595434 RepID=A0A0J1BME3_RHOIS|nr:hypothetical protein RISK_000327 [Rhodopirellula islandica]